MTDFATDTVSDTSSETRKARSKQNKYKRPSLRRMMEGAKGSSGWGALQDLRFFSGQMR